MANRIVKGLSMLHPICITLVLAFWMSASVLAADGVNQSPAKMSRTVTVELDYLISLPQGYEGKEKWPLILFLHGSGERGSDLEKVKVHGPPKLIQSGKQLPFIVVSPQCPSQRRWHATELSLLLDEIEEQYKVDKDRIYVTGLSMGGFGTWELATFSPERFAAIAPICGGGDRQFAKTLQDLPAWIFHGAKDTAVPVERSIEMATAIKSSGGQPKLTIYPDAGHDSWTQTYQNMELYDWFLQHVRKSD